MICYVAQLKTWLIPAIIPLHRDGGHAKNKQLVFHQRYILSPHAFISVVRRFRRGDSYAAGYNDMVSMRGECEELYIHLDEFDIWPRKYIIRVYDVGGVNHGCYLE
jgi:hypothetical protein